MKKKYFDILSGIQKKDSKPIELNDRVLIVDGLNTFIRAFAASAITSEQGYHIGGLTGFLLSLGYAVKNVNPTRIILAFDGKDGSQRRRKLFPEYKAGRKTHINVINTEFYNNKEEETQSMQVQLKRLIDYLEILPVQIISIDKIEADDTIAYLTKHFRKQFDSEVYIMSTDKDFLQLVDDKVIVWSPTKKKFYSTEAIESEYDGLPSKNFIFLKTFTGDDSDNIPGIKGVGLKTLKKRIPFLFEKDREIFLEDIIKYVTEKEKECKLYETISNSKNQLELNYTLMQLHDVDISATTKEKILNTIDQPINRMVKYKFISLLVADSINTIFKNPDVWIQTHFAKADGFASQTHIK